IDLVGFAPQFQSSAALLWSEGGVDLDSALAHQVEEGARFGPLGEGEGVVGLALFQQQSQVAVIDVEVRGQEIGLDGGETAQVLAHGLQERKGGFQMAL